jgi:hypothetical protein
MVRSEKTSVLYFHINIVRANKLRVNDIFKGRRMRIKNRINPGCEIDSVFWSFTSA